ncbi:unnamed protein product [Zymoseptoria tritici ST99CH_1A5]|uniref:Uncharacterized protein n=3 Tax=Zymoseptoria tritici TaxID=1047171 RepID=A0A1X7RQU2_ZYMT9|nr:unnamed protein product [Zymoseptoria tritici ST99CH_3D7]SMR49186.1 unnamed protein product [Zymoseptoria tritici ST99CH_1E4]SMR50362.1 unnamed protein product [Zymoseptoria tritici ST99CH_3D1]SMY23053.1 unnamed protein product [Zymoseptoria tritici ST99CH_1A5]
MAPRSPPPSYDAAIAAINSGVAASPQYHQGINAANSADQQRGVRHTNSTTTPGIPPLFHPTHDDVFAPTPTPTFTFDDSASDSSQQRTTSSENLTNASLHFEHAPSLQHLTAPAPAPPPPSQAFDFDFDNFTPNPLILEPWMSTSFENVSVMYQAGVAAQRRRRGVDGQERDGRRAGVGGWVDEGGDEVGRERRGGRVRRWIGRFWN